MPLVATWGQERVEAWRLDDQAWSTVRSTYREQGLVMTCGEPGTPVERAGTRFFRHKAQCDVHEGGPESPQHLAVKALVAEVARENGWTAVVEAPAPDRSWIADVLVSRHGMPTTAIEVQWAPQTIATFAERTERYERDEVKCVWLTGPKNHRRGDFNIRGTVDALEMEIPTGFAQDLTFMPLRSALDRWFRGDGRAQYEALIEGVQVETAMSKCHNTRCEKWYSYWWLDAVQLRTRCGQRGSVSLGSDYPAWARTRPDALFQDEVREAFAQSSLPAATEYRPAYSKTAGFEYLAQHCPHCRALLGDFFIIEKRRNWQSHLVAVTPKLMPLDPRVTGISHRCIDVGKGTCQVDTQQSPHLPQWNDTKAELSYDAFMPSSAPIQAKPLPAGRRRDPRQGSSGAHRS